MAASLSGCGGSSGGLDRDSAADLLEANVLAPGIEFNSTWAGTKDLVACLKSNGWLNRASFGYSFNLEDGQEKEGYIQLDALSKPPVGEDKVMIKFDVDAKLADVEVSGITSLGATDQSNLMKVEYTGRIAPQQSFTCFEKGIPITGNQYMRKYDDGWRLADLKNGMN